MKGIFRNFVIKNKTLIGSLIFGGGIVVINLIQQKNYSFLSALMDFIIYAGFFFAIYRLADIVGKPQN